MRGDLGRLVLSELICSKLALNRYHFEKNLVALSYIYTLSKDYFFFSFWWDISGYYTMSLIFLDYPCNKNFYYDLY